jgi:hypothetical protein
MHLGHLRAELPQGGRRAIDVLAATRQRAALVLQFGQRAALGGNEPTLFATRALVQLPTIVDQLLA